MRPFFHKRTAFFIPATEHRRLKAGIVLWAVRGPSRQKSASNCRQSRAEAVLHAVVDGRMQGGAPRSSCAALDGLVVLTRISTRRTPCNALDATPMPARPAHGAAQEAADTVRAETRQVGTDGIRTSWVRATGAEPVAPGLSADAYVSAKGRFEESSSLGGEKKNAKNFYPCRSFDSTDQKFFASFFQKRRLSVLKGRPLAEIRRRLLRLPPRPGPRLARRRNSAWAKASPKPASASFTAVAASA